VFEFCRDDYVYKHAEEEFPDPLPRHGGARGKSFPLGVSPLFTDGHRSFVPFKPTLIESIQPLTAP